MTKFNDRFAGASNPRCFINLPKGALLSQSVLAGRGDALRVLREFGMESVCTSN